jgi:hypothetical protein
MNPALLEELERNYQMRGAGAAVQRNTGGTGKYKKGGNLFTSLLPTAGSILGGIGGTILAPGVGTAAGGAGGALLGTKLRNLLTGQEDKLSDYAMEGAFGALGGIGKAAKSIKGAGSVLQAGGNLRTAGQILKSGQFADDAVKGGASALKSLTTSQIDNLTPTQISKLGNSRPFDTAQNLVENLINKGNTKGASRLAGMVPDSAVRDTLMSGIPGGGAGNILGRTASKMQSGASGLVPGKEIGALSNVESNAADLLKMGIKGSPAKQAKQIETTMRTLGGQVDDILRTNPTKLPGTQVTSRLQKGLADPTNPLFADLDITNPSVQKYLERYAQKFNGIDDALGINNQLKTVQSTAQRGLTKLRTPMSSPLTAQETAALAVKRAADDTLSNVPAIKPLKKQMATLFEVNPDVVKASQATYNVPFVNIKTKAPVQAFKGAQSSAAGLLAGPGGGGRFAGSGTIPGLLKAQTLRGGLTAMNPPQADSQEAAYNQDPTSPDMLGVDPAQFGYPADPTAMAGGMEGAAGILGAPSAPQTMYSREAAAQDIQKDLQSTGGKNMDKYLKLYEFLNPEPSKEADTAQGQSALVGLEQLQGLFSNAGGGQGIPGFIQKALGKGRINTDVEAYEKLRKTVAVPLARAMGEKGPLSDLDIKTWVNALPDVSDSPEAAQSKIQFLSQQLQAMQGGGSGSDASDILSQLGY